MFDTYLVRGQPDVHVHNKIEQKPHDAADAARLYGELKDKAEAAVANATVERFGAENEITVVTIEQSICTDTVRVLFKLNGLRFDFEAAREDVASSFYEIVSKALAARIMGMFRSRIPALSNRSAMSESGESK